MDFSNYVVIRNGMEPWLYWTIFFLSLGWLLIKSASLFAKKWFPKWEIPIPKWLYHLTGERDSFLFINIGLALFALIAFLEYETITTHYLLNEAEIAIAHSNKIGEYDESSIIDQAKWKELNVVYKDTEQATIGTGKNQRGGSVDIV